MSLLTHNWQEPDTSHIGQLVANAVREARLNQQVQQESQVAQSKALTDSITSALHEARVGQALDLKNKLAEHDRSNADALKQARIAELQSRTGRYGQRPGVEPWNPLPEGTPSAAGVVAGAGGDGQTVNLFVAGNPNVPKSSGMLGNVTYYGYADDPYMDSNTQAGRSAIGRLTPQSLAVSPDVEAKFREQGIQIGQPVKLQLSDGSEVTRTWDDRTSRKLTGRFDFNSPQGPGKDVGVVGFTPAKQMLAMQPESQSPLKPQDAPSAASVIAGGDLPSGPGGPSTSEALFGGLSPEAIVRVNAAGQIGGKKAAVQALQGELAVARKPGAASATGAMKTPDEIAAEKGWTANPDHGTYTDDSGNEVFVSTVGGKPTFKPFRPKEETAARWVQGSDGKPYALGRNGDPMQPIPDGVTLIFTANPKTFRDNTGNTFLIKPDQSLALLIPARAKLSAKESEQYLTDLQTLGQAKSDSDALAMAVKENGEGWFGVTKKKADVAAKEAEDALRKVQVWREQYPDLAVGASGGSQPPPTAAAMPQADRDQTLANARVALQKKPSAKDAIIARLKSAGIDEREL